jgi:hypothetical protein
MYYYRLLHIKKIQGQIITKIQWGHYTPGTSLCAFERISTFISTIFACTSNKEEKTEKLSNMPTASSKWQHWDWNLGNQAPDSCF